MKRIFTLLLCTLLFLTGCSSSDSSSANNQTESDTQNFPSNSSDTETVSKSYDDGTVSCVYNDSLLQSSSINETSTFSYGIIFTPLSSEPRNAITNGDCVYAVVMNLDNAYTFNISPLDSTKAIFDGVFHADSGIDSTVVANSDGTYSYTLSQSGFVCKGKVVSVSSESISLIVSLVSDSSDSDLINAFNECYDSISFSSSSNVSSSDLDDDWERLLKEAEDRSENSVKVTDGPLYDSVINVFQDISITDFGDSVSISIYLPHQSPNDASAMFFDIASSICSQVSLEDSYSSVTFNMFVDDTFIATLVLINYESSSSFSSSEPVVMVSEYEASIQKLYNTLFSSNDISNQFDANLESLKNKYGITN